MKWGRGWLSLAYLLATLLAQGVHDHDRGADDPTFALSGDCDNSRAHVASHEVGGSANAPGVCPSCQFRGQHSLFTTTARPLPGPGVAIPPPAEPPTTLDGSPIRPQSRGPPTG